MIELVALIVGVLLLSGFFSGSEAALLSISQWEVEQYLQEKRWGARNLADVFHHSNRAIIAIVIMNNMVNIIGTVLIGNRVIHHYGDAALALVTMLLTLGIIVCSEIIPKTLGIHYADRIALPVAVIIHRITQILLPFIIVLEWITHFFKSGARKVGTEGQIRSLARIGHRSGHIQAGEAQLIHRAFILNHRHAENVMTPLREIVSIRADATIRQAAEKVFRHTYSRYPVFGSSPNDVQGLALSQDILEAIANGGDYELVSTVARQGLLVSAKQSCQELLGLFRESHIHMAVVQDEGKTIGVVTLEDVLEELVGDIKSEIQRGK